MEKQRVQYAGVKPIIYMACRMDRPRPFQERIPAPACVQHSPRPQGRLFFPSDPSSFPPDEMAAGIFSQTYRIGKILGNGSFGCVCLAQNRMTRQEVVAKFILKPKCDPTKPNILPPFPLEVQILEKLRRMPGVVQLISASKNDNFYQIVMQKHGQDAIDLDKFIQRKGLGIPEPLAAYIFRQLTTIVANLHQIHGILHRDLKPANFLIDNRFNVQLIDFGCAGFMKKEGVPAYNATPLFRSPEAVFREVCNGTEAEVWALGITLYFMVFKCYPFHSVEDMKRNPVCLPPFASRALTELLMGMLARDYRQRWTTDWILNHRWVTQYVHLGQFHFY